MTFGDTFRRPRGADGQKLLRLTLLGVVIGVGRRSPSWPSARGDPQRHEPDQRPRQQPALHPGGSRRTHGACRAPSGCGNRPHLAGRLRHGGSASLPATWMESRRESFTAPVSARPSESVDTTVYGVTPSYQWVQFLRRSRPVHRRSGMSRRTLPARCSAAKWRVICSVKLTLSAAPFASPSKASSLPWRSG